MAREPRRAPAAYIPKAARCGRCRRRRGVSRRCKGARAAPGKLRAQGGLRQCPETAAAQSSPANCRAALSGKGSLPWARRDRGPPQRRAWKFRRESRRLPGGLPAPPARCGCKRKSTGEKARAARPFAPHPKYRRRRPECSEPRATDTLAKAGAQLEADPGVALLEFAARVLGHGGPPGAGRM